MKYEVWIESFADPNKMIHINTVKELEDDISIQNWEPEKGNKIETERGVLLVYNDGSKTEYRKVGA